MNSIYVFSLLLLGVSGALMFWHLASWRAAAANTSLVQVEREFAWGQFRRRMQASGMIGLIGAELAAHRLIPLNTIAVTLYLGSLGAMTLWVMLLAVGDVAATRVHFRQLSRMRPQTPISNSEFPIDRTEARTD